MFCCFLFVLASCSRDADLLDLDVPSLSGDMGPRWLLFYPSEEAMRLVEYSMEKFDSENSGLRQDLHRVLSQLFQGKPGSFQAVSDPAILQLSEIYITGLGQVVLEFSRVSEISQGLSLREEALHLMALLKTIFENFSSVSQVQIIVDGSYHETLWGKLRIEKLYQRGSYQEKISF